MMYYNPNLRRHIYKEKEEEHDEKEEVYIHYPHPYIKSSGAWSFVQG